MGRFRHKKTAADAFERDLPLFMNFVIGELVWFGAVVMVGNRFVCNLFCLFIKQVAATQ